MTVLLKKEMTGFLQEYMYSIQIVSGALLQKFWMTASEIKELKELLNKEELL